MVRRDRFKIEFSPLPIPTEPPDAPGGSYFYLSRQWKAYVRGMVSYLGMRRFWQDAPEQYDQILQWVYKLLDEIDLPEGETIEIEVPIYIPTESECDYDADGDYMCACGKCGTALYWDSESHKKYVMGADCQRVYLDDEPVTPELGGLEDWENAGQPPVPADLPVPHDNPAYRNNTEAMQCAKATAIVNEMWNLLSVYTAAEGGMTFAALASALIGWAGITFPVLIPAAVAAAWASFIATLISTIGLDAIIDDMQPLYDDEELKNEIICAIVEKMIPPEKVDFEWFGDVVALPLKVSTIYASDVQAAKDALKSRRPDAKISLKWIGLFPLKSWREIVTVKIPETLCGCEDYVPATGGGDEVPEGYLVVMPHMTPANDVTESEGDVNPLTLIAAAETSSMGTRSGYDRYIASTDNLTGNQQIGLLLILPSGVQVADFTYRVMWQGTTSGRKYQHGVHRATDGGSGFSTIFEIAEINASAPGAAPGSLIDGLFPALTSCKYIWIKLRTLSVPVGEPSLEVRNITLHLRALDGSWENPSVKIGVPFDPADYEI